MDCSACLLRIEDNDDLGYIVCTNNICNKAYHVLCTNAKNLTEEEERNWTCQDCRAKARKGGDNSHTPVRTFGNVTFRAKPARSESSGNREDQVSTPQASTTTQVHSSSTLQAPATTANVPNTDLQSLTSEIRLLRQTMIDMQSAINTRLDSISDKLLDFDSRIKSLEEYRTENVSLRTELESLQDQVNRQSQIYLKNELEVVGLMENPNENPYHLVLTTAKKIGLDLTEQDLDHATRVGPRPKGNSYENGVLKHVYRPLAVRFTRKAKRDEFIRQARSRRDLDSNQLVDKSPSNKIYVNERLTQHNRRLFRDARSYAEELGYKYCWVRNGSIYLRKREGRDGSPPILISSEKDLKSLVRVPSQGN